MTEKPRSKIDQARLHALAEIGYHESRMLALLYATHGMSRHARQDESVLRDSVTRLQSEISQDINNAYNHYLIFSGLMGGEEERQAKLLVMKRYLHENAYVANLLGYEGAYPALDEQIFRGELEVVRKTLEEQQPKSPAQEEG